MGQNSNKNLIQYAMEYGSYLGLMLIFKFVLASFSTTSSISNILASILIIAVPVMAFYFMRMFRDRSKIYTYGKLCLFGIYMYFFSALLSGIFEYIYYQYLNPDYLYAQQEALKLLVEELAKVDTSQTMSEFQSSYAAVAPTTAIQFVFQGIWGLFMLGSIYSLILALILRKRVVEI